MKQYIYADNAATTKLNNEAFEAMKPFLLQDYSNPSQPYSFSKQSKQALKNAREVIAKCINASSDEIYFTSGGTESDNWAIKGVFQTTQRKEIITSQIEHHAVLNSCEYLKKSNASISFLPVNSEGEVSPNYLSNIISKNTALVSVMYSNNEIGTIQPIKDLASITHKNGALFHTDAVQSVGHIQIDVKAINVDLLSASAHKFGGPKGIGFLYIKKGTRIEPFIHGGAQQFGFRAGTENVALIVGMAKALEISCDSLTEKENYLKELENLLLMDLKKANLSFIRNGSDNRIPGNISLSFEEAEGEMLLHRLDLMGICVSTGSACDSINTQVSHVIKAIGLDESFAKGTIRISLCPDNTKEEVSQIAKSLINILS